MTIASSPPPMPTGRNETAATLAWFAWYRAHGLPAPEDEAAVLIQSQDDVDGFLDLLDAQV